MGLFQRAERALAGGGLLIAGELERVTEQLRFACLAIPCSEALVALEIEALGRLSIPVVADEGGARSCDLHILPSGTPFAYLLGGGSSYAETEDDRETTAILAATTVEFGGRRPKGMFLRADRFAEHLADAIAAVRARGDIGSDPVMARVEADRMV